MKDLRKGGDNNGNGEVVKVYPFSYVGPEGKKSWVSLKYGRENLNLKMFNVLYGNPRDSNIKAIW